MAFAVHSIGFTGKFLSEAIEESKAGPIEALRAAGASRRAIAASSRHVFAPPRWAGARWDFCYRSRAELMGFHWQRLLSAKASRLRESTAAPLIVFVGDRWVSRTLQWDEHRRVCEAGAGFFAGRIATASRRGTFAFYHTSDSGRADRSESASPLFQREFWSRRDPS